MAERLRRTPGQLPGISEVTLAHIYRAEVARSTEWRTRLDTTTNWAITVAAAVVSFSFSAPASPHPTLLAGALLVFTFLVVDNYRDPLSEIVSETIESWDAQATSRRIELNIGTDLQYIRVNGTLVGGLVGLVLYFGRLAFS